MRKTKIEIGNQIILIIILSVMLCFMVIVYRKTYINSTGFNMEPVISLNEDFSIKVGKEKVNMDLPQHLKGENRQVVISKMMDKEDLVGDYICFYAYNASASVYIDGKMVYHESLKDDILHLARPSHWYLIKVPKDSFLLTVNLQSSTSINLVSQMYNGTKNALIFHIFEKNAYSILMGAIVLFLGFESLIASFVIKERLGRRLRWLGILSLIGGVLVCCLASFSQAFTNHANVVAFIGYCCFFVLPMTVCGFLQTYESFSKRKYFVILYWLQATITVIVFICQIQGYCHWSKLLGVAHVELIMIVAGVIVVFFKNNKEIPTDDKKVFNAMIILGLFICIDILRYYIVKPTEQFIKYTTMGLAVLIVYLAYSVISILIEKNKKEAKNEVYRELAFRDLMTNVNNRTAYEERLSAMKKAEFRANTFFLLADLNNLKKINDTYGHYYGDDAIIRVASLLKEHFSDIGECYRIGGDEFMVISQVEDLSFKKHYENFVASIGGEDDKVKYSFSVATAYEKLDERGIEQCIRDVDTAMYENKRQSKKSRGNGE